MRGHLTVWDIRKEGIRRALMSVQIGLGATQMGLWVT